ncbi:hypothetical protein D3C77_664690 [compost metagenome]
MLQRGPAQTPGQPAGQLPQRCQGQPRIGLQAPEQRLVASLQRVALPRRQLPGLPLMRIDTRPRLPAQVPGFTYLRTGQQEAAQPIGTLRQRTLFTQQSRQHLHLQRLLAEPFHAAAS